MEIAPLPFDLFNDARNLGINRIELNFQGGSDEGYLNVELWGVFTYREYNQFAMKVYEWADNEYAYSGAGDGSDYGDDITYDLISNQAESSSWYMERVDGESFEEPLLTGQPSMA